MKISDTEVLLKTMMTDFLFRLNINSWKLKLQILPEGSILTDDPRTGRMVIQNNDASKLIIFELAGETSIEYAYGADEFQYDKGYWKGSFVLKFLANQDADKLVIIDQLDPYDSNKSPTRFIEYEITDTTLKRVGSFAPQDVSTRTWSVTKAWHDMFSFRTNTKGYLGIFMKYSQDLVCLKVIELEKWRDFENTPNDFEYAEYCNHQPAWSKKFPNTDLGYD
jgi:hypothetical protein